MIISNSKYKYINLKGKVAREHQLIASAVLGKPLRRGVVIHHVDGDKANNTKANLVMCQSIGYHKLLHRRIRSMEATGERDKIRCNECKDWFYQDEMSGNNTITGRCKPCHASVYRKGGKYFKSRAQGG